jgi:hypothetical protein
VVPTKEALMSRLPTAFALCAALVMAGCGTAEYDWNKAMAANTLAAYQTFVKNHFLQKYPQGVESNEARRKLKEYL